MIYAGFCLPKKCDFSGIGLQIGLKLRHMKVLLKISTLKVFGAPLELKGGPRRCAREVGEWWSLPAVGKGRIRGRFRAPGSAALPSLPGVTTTLLLFVLAPRTKNGFQREYFKMFLTWYDKLLYLTWMTNLTSFLVIFEAHKRWAGAHILGDWTPILGSSKIPICNTSQLKFGLLSLKHAWTRVLQISPK